MNVVVWDLMKVYVMYFTSVTEVLHIVLLLWYDQQYAWIKCVRFNFLNVSSNYNLTRSEEEYFQA
jgi:hypothetical protein